MGLFGSSSKKVLFMRVNQVSIDLVIFCLAFFVSFFIRFEGLPRGDAFRQMMLLFPYIVIARIICFALFSVYSIIWRFISVADIRPIIRALLPVSLLLIVGRLFLPDRLEMLRLPLSIISMEFLFSLAGVMGIRVLRRLQYEEGRRHQLKEGCGEPGQHRCKTLLIGAGSAGNIVAKELKQRADLGLDIVGFVDDDGQKTGKHIQGFPVLGTTPQIPRLAKDHGLEEAVITIVNASSKQIRRISGLCAEAGLKTRIVPGLFELFDKRITITKVREISIDDILGRSVFNLDQYFNEVAAVYHGKRILVTGAGGSIGSELCRQLAAMGPSEIVLLDKDENGVFDIDNDLRGRLLNGTAIHPVIANITNQVRLRALFARFRPQIVFHAAAHKHVPLMENNVTEAILNNVGGTKNVVDIAGASGVERVIFISTDKAVNPTNIMGATKKIGEAYVQARAKQNDTKFACVRFGNVVGSRGSVVPIFQKQIAQGGPVTVTHPEVRRYFMSIPEAVHLIIQAGTLGEKGEIFVLDMGKPIKILDLVKSLIRLSGHKEEDIEIKFVGMRPGEKMFEEILIDEEKTRATKFEKIFIAPPLEFGNGRAMASVDSVIEAAAAGDGGKIVRELLGMGIGFSSEAHR